MTALLPALAGALVVAGLLGLVVGLRPAPPRPPAPRRSHPAPGPSDPVSARTRLLLLAGLAAGRAGGCADRVVGRSPWSLPGRRGRAAGPAVRARRPRPGSTGSRRWRNGPAPCPAS